MSHDLSSLTGEWHTPDEYARSIRKVLGPIDFDPFSREDANARIRALDFRSQTVPGGWPDEFVTVYCNPPGGKGNRNTPKKAWAAMMVLRARGLLRHAIFMGYNISILRSAQMVRPGIPSPHLTPLNRDFTFCVPRERIEFMDSEDERGEDPTRDNVIIYIPGSPGVPGALDRTDHFLLEFQRWGDCR